ncbi:recombination regulator RecX [Sporosarcina highlanderae]|uniref:Regulatory protein RecX n=1 Tax=Sporosarcina highlanderae TaxID=3035916 RepID=A0ABT8JW33_9BACL|nr:recombination regulator RecX [Sporosarcina highlanderae]MDN4608384.1 recombination regulator RecX [Sporosarcina highlanderae]
MGVLTKITQQKRDTERYNIFIDDKYAFSVHESVLVKFGLTKGMQLDEWAMDEIAYEDRIEKAFNRALHFLSFRMRSEFEVKKKLMDLEYGEAVVLEAIVKLRRLGFLDDQAFSEALMRTQKNASNKGPKAIQQELQKKGVGKELQEQVLENYSEEEQFAVAKRLAEKAAASNRSIAPAQLKQKIQNALARKGFSFSLIGSVMEEIDFGREEDEWDSISSSVGEKAWRRYKSKYSGYELRNRVKQSMYQKGIPLERIERFIEKKENEEDGDQ